MDETVSEQKADFDKIETCVKEISDDFIKNQENLFNSLKEELSKIKKIKEKSHIGEFNIFKSIAEAYKQKNDDRNRFSLEGPNSDILQLILSPKSKEIGNPEILKDFLQYIGIDDDSIKEAFPNLDEVEIKREASIDNNGRIDLLIKNEKHCVIIESKLNNAPNQPFQLQRYYLAETKEKIEVVKIVYLTLVPCGELDFDNDFELYKNETKYSEEELREFKNVIPDVKKRLVYLPATNKQNEKSLCDFFNDEVKKIDNKLIKVILSQYAKQQNEKFFNAELEKNNYELIKVILSQYTKLLTELGGIEEMLLPEKELIKKIYESEESVENAETFAEIWKNKDEIIKELLDEKFKEEYTGKGWRFEDDTFYKTAKENLDFYICFYPRDKWARNRWFEFGFLLKKGTCSPKEKESLRKFLDKILSDLHIAKHAEISEDEGSEVWIYVCFYHEEELWTLNEKFEKAVNALEKLEKSFKSFEK